MSKPLLRRKNLEEICNNKLLAVENWANELIPRVIDTYTLTYKVFSSLVNR